MFTLLLLLLLCAAPVLAQEQPSDSDNPLATLYDALEEALAASKVPITAEQERAIALMMEDRRRASEELFGDLMDFRGGPTEGQREDRLRSAIEWMENEFLRNVESYLTAEQRAVWPDFLAARQARADSGDAGGGAGQDQTQYVRINNNSFTAEDDFFGGGGGGGGGFTEVIQRGGVGAWHGNAQLLVKDDALNARNAFADNEPPYQERRLNVDVSGPAIPGRLTTSFEITSNETKNASTVRATLPDGVFALGITRPNTFREYRSRGTLQLADAHSLDFAGRYATEASKDQGIGDFTLPERASDSEWRSWNVEVGQFSTFSNRSIFEAELNAENGSSETIPLSEDVRINVLDAFNGGGAQNRSENDNRSWRFDTMFTRLGEKVVLKTGLEADYRNERSLSTNNYGGTFTFSSLEAYLAGRPINYRVTRGNPLLEVDQLAGAAFVQADAAVTSQLTLMFGLRYDAQSTLDDYNNVSPRVSFAYAPGEATVIRGGAGLYYNGLDLWMVKDVRRFDGRRQFELVIDDPSYPDPFAGGTIRRTFPSVRVMDPDLVAPSVRVGMISVERTFLSNLLVSVSYDYRRQFHRLRTRNVNAPYDATSPVPRSCRAEQPDETCVRPDPTRGNILSLESSGNDIQHNLQVNVRKRFSIFNVSGEYRLQRIYGDVQGQQGAEPSDHYDLQRDWGHSPTPLHNVQATVNARLPFGIFLTARMDGNSGRYYSIRTGRDDNRDNNLNDRPAGVPPNSLRGPAYLDFDFNISKAFFFRDSGTGPNVNVFLNMTNAFNHVHYGTPSGVLTSPNFGRSTSAQDPREIEAGIRFQF